jgi:hypothetical protein
MARKQPPEIINLSEDELDLLQSRLASSPLLEDDKKIIMSIVTTYSWLIRKLGSAKLTIHRLKAALGFTTEKRSWAKKKKNNTEKIGDSSLGLEADSSDDAEKSLEAQTTKKQ